ncbi:MAG TPA: DCC1-like thiol-disulfide oxidoreductase family protein [Solirubrobacteraceae bacterium]|nr:DCC1-like thiol-disulfide oxidoreductase family protein [Solirubrobacteraceae bacterium]
MARDTDKRAAASGERMHVSRRERPVLVYDGDCAFCTTCVRVLERIAPDAELVAWQLTDLAELGLTEAQAAAAVQWVQTDGTIRSGHEAIAATLRAAGPAWKIIGRVALLPGISGIAAKLYRLVADNRQRLPGGTPACAVTADPAAPARRSAGARRARR